MSKVLTVIGDKLGSGRKPKTIFSQRLEGKMKKNQETTQEVLLQKLGNVWYAFSEVEDDVIYTALPHGVDPYSTKFELLEVIEDHMKKVTGKRGYSPEAAM